jgi:hypothetical protein
VVHTPGPQAQLRQRETDALVAEAARDRHSHIAKQQLAVAVDRLVLHHGHDAHDAQAGAVHGHEQQRVAA